MSHKHHQLNQLLTKINTQTDLISKAEIPSALDVDLLRDYIKQFYDCVLQLESNKNEAPQKHFVSNESVFEIKPSHVADEIKQAPLRGIKTEPVKENPVVAAQKEPTKSSFEDYASVGQKFTEQESIHHKLSPTHISVGVGDKMQDAPVTDLIEAIGVNERFAFANVFMNGDINMFYTMLAQLNAKSTFDEAWIYFKENMVEKFNVDKNNKAYREFVELLKRRFVK